MHKDKEMEMEMGLGGIFISSRVISLSLDDSFVRFVSFRWFELGLLHFTFRFPPFVFRLAPFAFHPSPSILVRQLFIKIHFFFHVFSFSICLFCRPLGIFFASPHHLAFRFFPFVAHFLLLNPPPPHFSQSLSPLVLNPISHFPHFIYVSHFSQISFLLPHIPPTHR